MRAHRVRALLMGGQACVFYGAAEFSRDTDFAILADAANLARLRKALAEWEVASSTSGYHCVPSQRAAPWAPTSPACVNGPKARSSFPRGTKQHGPALSKKPLPFEPSQYIRPPPPNPRPKDDQAVPLNFAIKWQS